MAFPRKWDGILYKFLILGASFFFLGFEAVRAVRAPLTYDEANTYLNIIASNILAIFNFNTANNHFLNSLLAKLSSAVAGTAELVLRLPNLLAFAAYLLFAFLILDRFVKTKIVVLCGFLLLSLNPFVLDYFSLCRGYGLSLGLLMASLFFFFSFLDKTLGHEPNRYRHLQLSLAALGLGILANFSLLNVYLSLVIFAFGFLAFVNRKNKDLPRPAGPVRKKSLHRKILWPVFITAAFVFNLLVAAQDFSLANKLFEPVSVRITGITDREKQEIQVLRLDNKNEEQPLTCQDDLWRPERPTYFTSIKFRCPTTLVDKIEDIQIRIGRETFHYDAFDLKKFRTIPGQKYSVISSLDSVSLKRSIIPAFKPVINWKGDSVLFVLSLRRLLFPGGLWATAVVILFLLGRLLERIKILDRDQFRPMAATSLTLVLFTGYPLYILKTSGALWLGGSTGLVRDTVFSLIDNSFYGKLYFRGQARATFFFLCLSLIVFSMALYFHGRRKSLVKAMPGLSVLAILLFASVSTMIQNILLGTPYLAGRTALFFIPLFTLLLIFLFHDLVRLKAGQKVASIALLTALTILGLYHFSARASTVMTAEWRKDADTKILLKDLQEFRDKDIARQGKISLGIDAVFYPSLQYYLKRGSAAWLDVHIVPPYKGCDFYYLNDTIGSSRTASLGMRLVKEYPRSGNILVTPRPD